LQEEFAAQVGLSRNQLANYENGRTPLPSGVALRICRHFIIGEQWLATGDSWPWAAVDLLSEPEAVKCDPNKPFGPNFDDKLWVKYFTLNTAKETALTFRERYDRLVKNANGDKHRLWFILNRLLRKPMPVSGDKSPPSEDPDDLADFYETLIMLCVRYEIKWSGGIA
jgi:transcriptional regulator with XRE-family HTH domain